MGSGSWESSGTLRHSRTKVEPSTSRDIFYFSTSRHDWGRGKPGGDVKVVGGDANNGGKCDD